MGVYYIDFLDKNPIVSEYEAKYLNEDLTKADTSDVMALDEPDWRIFKNPKHAHEFLARYLHILKHELDNKKICHSRELPCLLYKRRYIVQSLMGVKNQTYRHYKRDWKPGQLINLHDQTFFLTVRIDAIIQTAPDEWKYEFTIPERCT